MAVVLAGFAVGLLFLYKRGAWLPPLVIVWAYAGIVLKRVQVDRDYSAPVWVAALAAAAVLLAGSAIVLARGIKKDSNA